MNKIVFVILLIFLAACHKKIEQKPDQTNIENESALSQLKNTNSELKSSQISDKPPRELRAAVYFAGSLEREALRLLLKNDELQRPTLFSVLSYGLELKSGAKKSAPQGLDCSKINVDKVGQTWVFKKACRQPASEIAYIKIISEKSDYEVSFVIEHWPSVLGMSAVITGSNIICKMKLFDEKLSALSCDNWSYQVSEGKLSATVIKIDEFVFNRNAENQLKLKGGFYSELVKNKNIDITVPLQGKIKIIEKELKVIDEFSAFKDGVINENKIEENKSAVEKTIEIGEIKSSDESKVGEEGEQKVSDQNREIRQDQGENQQEQNGIVESGEREIIKEEQQPQAPRRGR